MYVYILYIVFCLFFFTECIYSVVMAISAKRNKGNEHRTSRAAVARHEVRVVAGWAVSVKKAWVSGTLCISKIKNQE